MFFLSYLPPLADELEKEKLRSLALMFNRHNVCRMWGDLSSLQNLAWEKAWHSCPALHPDHRPDVVLPDFTPANFRNTVNHLYNEECGDERLSETLQESGTCGGGRRTAWTGARTAW